MPAKLQELSKYLGNNEFFGGKELNSLDVVTYIRLAKHLEDPLKSLVDFKNLKGWFDRAHSKIDPILKSIFADFTKPEADG